MKRNDLWKSDVCKKKLRDPNKLNVILFYKTSINNKAVAIKTMLIGGESPASVASGGPLLIKRGMSFTTLVIVILQRGAPLIGIIHIHSLAWRHRLPPSRIVYTLAPIFIYSFIYLLTCSQAVIKFTPERSGRDNEIRLVAAAVMRVGRKLMSSPRLAT